MNELWDHQKRVSALLKSGKNVILQSPTGSGKTRAALDHFLLAQFDKTPFPRRCIYSVPMRVLAKQFYTEYSKIAERYQKRFALPTPIIVKTQTGEQPNDPELTANLIFATIDQTLSSYLLAPYSLGKRRANPNAGAVMSSYLVFDEFHLYDPASTLPTTLHMLKTFKGISPFVLMTATFSQTMLTELADLLDSVIVPGNETEHRQLAELPTQQKQRFYHTAKQPLSAHAVLDTHEQRSLVICNTVDRARRLYHDLVTYTRSTEIEVILLHSRFLSEDRHQIETRIQALFGKESDKTVGSYIVVATQAIEVGVDMTSTILHTELAPANAIIQRAGRCARYENETGHVYIYGQTINLDDSETPLDLTHPDHAAPYKSQVSLFPLTFEAFQARDGERFTFADEQTVLTQVHEMQDQAIITQLREENHYHAQTIYAVQRGDTGSDPRHLIREIQQQNLIVHADPDWLLQLDHISPLMLPAFGLHPGTLMKYIQRWQEQADQLNTWATMFLYDYGLEKSAEGAVQNNQDRYRWHEIKTPKDALFAPLVVVNPQLVTYDSQRGFVPEPGEEWQTPIPDSTEVTAPREGVYYRLETYAEHIRRVYDAFSEIWWEAEWAAQRLEARFGWQMGSVKRAAVLAVLLHDVGKLSVGWQQWVREYQQKIAKLEDDIGLEVEPGEAYAHTELQTQAHRDIEHSMRKRPWHAVEGAVATLPVIAAVIENDLLMCGVFAAIARHHAPFSDEHQPYKLTRNAHQQIAVTFKSVSPVPDLSELLASAEREEPNKILPNPDGERAAFLVYLLIARALRRADVEGTRRGGGKRY